MGFFNMKEGVKNETVTVSKTGHRKQGDLLAPPPCARAETRHSPAAAAIGISTSYLTEIEQLQLVMIGIHVCCFQPAPETQTHPDIVSVQCSMLHTDHGPTLRGCQRCGAVPKCSPAALRFPRKLHPLIEKACHRVA